MRVIEIVVRLRNLKIFTELRFDDVKFKSSCYTFLIVKRGGQYLYKFYIYIYIKYNCKNLYI